MSTHKRLHSLLFSTLVYIGANQAVAQNLNYKTPNSGKLQYAQEVESKAVENKDSLLLAEAYYLFGKIYAAASDLETSQDYFLKSMRILEKRGASYELGRLYLRLSELSTNKETAIQLVKHSLEICKEAGSERGVMNARKRLIEFKVGSLPVGKNGRLSSSEFKEVLSEYLGIKKIYANQKDTLGVAELNLLIGSLLIEHQRIDAAYYLKRASAGFEQKKKKRQAANCQLLLAKTMLMTGATDAATRHLMLAEKYYIEDEVKELYIEQNFAEAYMEYYRALGDWKKVAEWQDRFSTISNEMAVADRDEAIYRLNLEYQTELKEARLNAQASELALKDRDLRQRNAYLLALSVLLVAALGSGAGYYRLSRKYKRISTQNAQLVHEQNHRVKNNLQLVSSLLYLQASRMKDEQVRSALEESQLRIDIMAALQRKLYENEQLVSIPMLSFVTEIVDMALSAFGYGYTKVDVTISPGLLLPTDKAMSLGLIINELVTNACKHAFPTVATPALSVSLGEHGDGWTLRVADNGADSLAPDAMRSSRLSFGYRLIMLQVEQLMGTYRIDTRSGTIFELMVKSPGMVSV